MLTIREARLDDARRIAEIHVRSWQEAYRGIMPDAFLAGLKAGAREESWRQTLARSGRTVIVAEDGGVVAGWAIGGASRDADAPPGTAEVYAINIDPASWRQGAGRLLMRHACARFRKEGYDRVTLWVLAENQGARRFYAALGFAVDAGDTKTGTFGGRDLVEFRYTARLDP